MRLDLLRWYIGAAIIAAGGLAVFLGFIGISAAAAVVFVAVQMPASPALAGAIVCAVLALAIDAKAEWRGRDG